MWTLSFLGKADEAVPLILRLLVGVAFAFFHGYGNLVGPDGFDGGAAFAANASALAPAPLLYLAAWTEFLAGCAILLGILTRWASLGLLGIMAFALFKIHWSQGFTAHVADGRLAGYEFAAAYAVMCVSIALLGPGTLSLDVLFFRKAALNESRLH